MGERGATRSAAAGPGGRPGATTDRGDPAADASALSFGDPLVDALLATSPVAIGMVDRDLRFVRANAKMGVALETFAGIGLGTGIVGRTLAELAPPLVDRLAPLCERVFSTGESVPEFVVEAARGGLGDRRFWTIGLFPVRVADQSVAYVGGIARDITDEFAAQRRADETDQRIGELLSRVTDGFVALDRSLVLTHVNPQAAAMLGRTPEELLGHDFRDLFPDESGTPFEMAYGRAMRKQVPLVVEGRYAPSDRWFENRIFPSLDGLSIFFSDISERKALELQLRREAARLEGLHAIDSLILAAVPLEEVAAGALEHLERVAPFDHAHVAIYRGGVRHVLAVRGLPAVPAGVSADDLPESTRQRIRDGSPFETDITDLPSNWFVDRLIAAGLHRGLLAPLSPGQGDPIGYLAIYTTAPEPIAAVHAQATVEAATQMSIALRERFLRDEVARYTAELERRVVERTAELEQRSAELELRTAELAERNDELEAFSYTVSHDLRAPLRAIRGFSQALAEDQADKLDAEGREYVERVVRAAGRLDVLIQDLLAYSRLSRAEFTLSRVDLDLAVRDALAQLEAELAERQASVEVAGPFPTVRAHRGTLVQVIANLVSNAAKFVANDAAPQVRIRAERRDGVVRCWVDDNGIGVAPEHRERIFRVFERLHGIEAYPGTGIGLAIVRKGLERMGGSAGCEAGEDGGSRFWIELAAVEEQS